MNLGSPKLSLSLARAHTVSLFLASRLSLASSLSLSSSSFFWLLPFSVFFLTSLSPFCWPKLSLCLFRLPDLRGLKAKNVNLERQKKCNFHPLFSFFTPLSTFFHFPIFSLFWLLDFFCSEPGSLNIHNFQPLQHRGRNDN